MNSSERSKVRLYEPPSSLQAPDQKLGSIDLNHLMLDILVKKE